MLQKKKLLKGILMIMTVILVVINLMSLNVSANIKEYKIDDIFIREDNYDEKINEQVIPYLNSIMNEGNIHGKDDIELYYRKYKVEDSIGSIVISHGFGEVIESYKEGDNISKNLIESYINFYNSKNLK